MIPEKGREKLVLEWRDIEDGVEKIISQIKDIQIDSIVALGRGGIIPASLILRSKPEAIFKVVQISNYVEDAAGEVVELLTPEIMHGQYLHLDFVRTKNVLVVDDIADTGASINKVCCLLEPAKPASLFTSALFARSEDQVDFYGELERLEYCIIFPWEKVRR